MRNAPAAGSLPTGEVPRPVVFQLAGGAYAQGVYVGARNYARSRRTTWRLVPRPLGFEDHMARGIIGQFVDLEAMPCCQPMRCPAVNVADNHNRFDIPTVISDNLAIGRMAAEYLISQGYRHFGIYAASDTWYAGQRRVGFETTARQSACKTCMLQISMGSTLSDFLRARLQDRLRPIAVFACNDVDALEVVNAALHLGLRVPEDVAVLGVDDDVALCETSSVPISSVAVNAELVGYEAAALLDRLLQGEPAPTEPIEIPPLRVVVRESTDVGSAGDPIVARALRLIADAMDESLTVDRLADALDISRRTLEQRFRRVLGRGPAEELRRQRIERAKILLQETTRTVLDVALRSGFAGAPQFSSAFRQATGMSPSAFRRRVHSIFTISR